MWIDAHCHLAAPAWDARRAEEIQCARKAGVGAWIQGGIDPADWQRQKTLRKTFGDAIVPCFGLHPWWVGSVDDAAVTRASEELTRELPGAAALGELGLDLAPKHAASFDRQKHAFEFQLGLVRRTPKPLVLHIVQAHEQALGMLEASGPFPKRGLVHAFGGNIEVARRYLALGFVLSVGGAALRPGYIALKCAIPLLPPQGLVIETDSEGDANPPANLIRIAGAVAALRGETPEALLDRSAKLLAPMFGIEK